MLPRTPRPLPCALVALLAACAAPDAPRPPEPAPEAPAPTPTPHPCGSPEDRDGDGTPDGCDPCPDDPGDDSDGDTVCDGADRCPGSNDLADADADGTPDGCDVEDCEDGRDNDGDGRADALDADCAEDPTPPEPAAPCPPEGSSTEDVQFAEVADCAGLKGEVDVDAGYYGSAQAWGDFDGDGWVDLVTGSPTGPTHLVRATGSGLFDDADHLLPHLPDTVGGAVFVDYDGDGLRDLHLLRLGPDVLFRNEGGAFTDVSAAAGLDLSGMSQGAAWADYDGDGDLDVYVVRYDCPECTDGAGAPLPRASDDVLLRNDGGTFTDVSALLPALLRSGPGYAASWSDLDLDGDPDLLVVNDHGYPGPPPEAGPLNRNVLFRNDGPGCGGWCFAEVGEATGAGVRIQGMGVAIGDYDNDLDPDLLMSTDGPAVLLRATEVGFLDVSLAEGTGELPEEGTIEGWGLHWFEVDNDGRLDFFEARGEATELSRGNLRLGTEGGGFADGLDLLERVPPARCYGTARADYDLDGFEDFVVGCAPDGHRLFRNLGAGVGRWLKLRLEGSAAMGADAVGARVVVTDTTGRSQVREVIVGSSLGAGHDTTLHFGLGSAQPASVTITWPDGTVDPLGALPANVLFSRARSEAPAR